MLVRSAIQCVLRKFGGVAQRHCGKVIMLGFIPLIVFAFGLTRAKLETDAENLWIEGMRTNILQTKALKQGRKKMRESGTVLLKLIFGDTRNSQAVLKSLEINSQNLQFLT